MNCNKMVDFTQLKTNPSNPRKISKEQFEKLKKSISGFTKMLEVRPIAYDEDGIIWGGNMRYEALKSLGIEMKPEYFKELTGYTLEEKKEFAIRDNVELGEWDDDILANEWSDLPLDDWGVSISGWDAEIIDDMSLENKDHTFSQMTFTLSLRQEEIVKEAIKKADSFVIVTDNENSNGNALEVICNAYIG